MSVMGGASGGDGRGGWEVKVGRTLALIRPRSEHQLHGWLSEALGVRVPRAPVVAGNSPPFAYLCHAFFEDRVGPADAVVWAARGSGKTFYAAVATALDLVFKPGIQVRILGGSLEQSKRMHEHLRGLFRREELSHLLGGVKGDPLTERRVSLRNGSRAELLAQSQTSVRGVRPNKLRCDELELFDAEVWSAAQLTTRSCVVETEDGPMEVRGAIEAISTFHRPGGLMGALTGGGAVEGGGVVDGRRVFRWSVMDVLARCEAERACDGCVLWDECGGRAKRFGERGRGAPAGHFSVGDAVVAKERAGEAVWRSEMMCAEPSRSDAVLPEFDRGRHVVRGAATGEGLLVAGMDFGLRSPTVVVFAEVGEPTREGGRAAVRVIGEHVASDLLLEEHIDAIARHPAVAGRGIAWIGVDPAGHQRNDQTGLSPVSLLKRAGLQVRTRRLSIESGLRLLRARLSPASGGSELVVDAGCAGLIDSLERYEYGVGAGGAVKPMKNGPDHAVDALRYMLTNLDAGWATTVRRYV